MSAIEDFNRVEDCDKIDANCINAYVDYHLDEERPTFVCLETSWGGDCLDMTSVVKAAETCTTLYLSPENNPNCLIYEPECGDNICINGDDLSRIISMSKLKDVDQVTAPNTGDVYMYNAETNLFETFNLSDALGDLSGDIANLLATINNLRNRIVALETKLTPPADAPANVKVVFGNINEYSDPNVVISEGSGTVTTLDKTHGLYTHTLASNAYGDEIFG